MSYVFPETNCTYQEKWEGYNGDSRINDPLIISATFSNSPTISIVAIPPNPSPLFIPSMRLAVSATRQRIISSHLIPSVARFMKILQLFRFARYNIDGHPITLHLFDFCG
jgi:hypothetical protein